VKHGSRGSSAAGQLEQHRHRTFPYRDPQHAKMTLRIEYREIAQDLISSVRYTFVGHFGILGRFVA